MKVIRTYTNLKDILHTVAFPYYTPSGPKIYFVQYDRRNFATLFPLFLSPLERS